jgi:ATP-dependent metalloprotease FtsH
MVLNSTIRQVIFWVVIIGGAFLLYRFFNNSPTNQPQQLTYSELVSRVAEAKIQSATIEKEKVTGKLDNGVAFTTELPNEHVARDLAEAMKDKKVKFEFKSSSSSGMILQMVVFYAPFILIIAFWIFMLRQMQSGGNKALSFGKSRAKLLSNQQKRVTFKDVAGVEEAKEELQEIIEFLKEPQKFQKLGGRIPKGVLMMGPPGTGKTLLARAIAGEANVPFFSISGSDFVEMFVGVGASRVRDLFEQGKKNAPCLTGDTVITLSGGRQASIQEMFDKKMVGAQVPAMTADFRLEDATIIGITRKPCADLYEITTVTGAIKATGNHLFPVLRGSGMEWVRANELSEDDYVAIPRRINTADELPLFSEFLPAETIVRFSTDLPKRRLSRLNEVKSEVAARHPEVVEVSIGHGGFASSYLNRAPLYLNEDIAYFCGLLASDGCLRKSDFRTIQFVNTELALHEKVNAILEEQFGYGAKRHLNKKHYEIALPQGNHPQTLQDCYTTFINNKLLCEALRAIEARILELPGDLVAAWLRGVFDGDGCVRVSHQTPQVIISAWDQPANQFIRDALLRIGIVTSYSPSARKGKDGNIVITGLENLKTFIAKIGSGHPAKQAKLTALSEILNTRKTSASRLDSVPVGALLREARLSVGMGQRAFTHGNYVSTYERDRVAPSRTSLQAVVGEIEAWREERNLDLTDELTKLKDLAHSDVLWSRIQRIEPIAPVEYVYDLCLDRHNCFIANNLIVHNCIIFIDEIDAVGRHRGAGLGGGHDEREQTLNQLLVEMDGFESNDGVILIASTNRPDVLDPALLRPGRFDRRVIVNRPDVKGREGILAVHTRKIPLGEDVDISVIARGTPGFTGADLANLVNEAALNAARYNKKVVAMLDFEWAKDKVLMGSERKSAVMSEEEKITTAYHEAGHTVVGLKVPNADPVHKVTIIPRGMALGLTQQLPEGDRYTHSRDYIEGSIAILMGGRLAEDIFLGKITTGASNDIERATELARKMVCEFGMSNLGPLTFGKKEEQIFLGREIAQHQDYSEDTAIKIDQEVKRIVMEQYERARQIILENRDALDRLAQELLARETLDSVQIRRVVAGLSIDDDTPRPRTEPEAGKPADKEPVLKPILPPITGSNPATA